MIEKNNCCVSCGKIIPEGCQVCHSCMEDNEQREFLAEYSRKQEIKRKQRNENPHKLREIWYEFINKISLFIIKTKTEK